MVPTYVDPSSVEAQHSVNFEQATAEATVRMSPPVEAVPPPQPYPAATAAQYGPQTHILEHMIRPTPETALSTLTSSVFDQLPAAFRAPPVQPPAVTNAALNYDFGPGLNQAGGVDLGGPLRFNRPDPRAAQAQERVQLINQIAARAMPQPMAGGIAGNGVDISRMPQQQQEMLAGFIQLGQRREAGRGVQRDSQPSSQIPPWALMPAPGVLYGLNSLPMDSVTSAASGGRIGHSL